MTNRLSRRILLMLTSLAVAMAPVSMATMALADDGSADNGFVVVSDQEGVRYLVYQVLSGNGRGEGRLSDIEWGSNALPDEIVSVIERHGYQPPEDDRLNAQSAAEWLYASLTDVDGGTSPIAYELADILISAASPMTSTIAGMECSVPDGWYCVVADPSSTEGRAASGTEPILVPVTGGMLQFEEKASMPSVSKEVMEDSNETWGKLADAEVGQEVRYRLVGTVPGNISSYDSYEYRFVDELPKHLMPKLDSVTVVVDGREVTDSFKVSFSDSVLKVEASDLLSIPYVEIRAESTITVSYTAQLVPGTPTGMRGAQTNEVHIEYTNDPVSGGIGRSRPDRSTVLTYRILINKLSEGTNKPLADAEFTLRTKNGPYVQPDGTLSRNSHTFVTSSDGKIAISGLDEGEYILTETKAPAGYAKLEKPVNIVLRSTLQEEKPTLYASLDRSASISAVSMEDGLVEMRIEDPTTSESKRRTTETLAHTGVGITAFVTLSAGLALVAVGSRGDADAE